MVSWNDLPSDVCRAILFEFVNVVADEYSGRRDWCGRKLAKRIEKYGTAERIFAMLEARGDESDDSSEEDEEDEGDEDEWDDRSKLEKRLESAGPLPLSWFASALRVNREFSSILTSITIGGYQTPEKLKTAQCEMFEFALKYFEYEYKNVDGQYDMSLYDLTTLVGNFWANFDCFQHGVNIVSRISNLMHRRGNTFIPYLFPFLQRLSETVPPTSSPTTEDADHKLEPHPHPSTYVVEELYREACSQYIPVSGGDEMDSEITVFRVVGISPDFAKVLPDLKCCAVAKEIEVSPSREWLAVSFSESWSGLDYFVNFKKRRCFEYKDSKVVYNRKSKDFITRPAGWKDVSDKVGEFWPTV